MNLLATLAFIKALVLSTRDAGAFKTARSVYVERLEGVIDHQNEVISREREQFRDEHLRNKHLEKQARRDGDEIVDLRFDVKNWKEGYHELLYLEGSLERFQEDHQYTQDQLRITREELEDQRDENVSLRKTIRQMVSQSMSTCYFTWMSDLQLSHSPTGNHAVDHVLLLLLRFALGSYADFILFQQSSGKTICNGGRKSGIEQKKSHDNGLTRDTAQNKDKDMSRGENTPLYDLVKKNQELQEQNKSLNATNVRLETDLSAAVSREGKADAEKSQALEAKAQMEKEMEILQAERRKADDRCTKLEEKASTMRVDLKKATESLEKNKDHLDQTKEQLKGEREEKEAVGKQLVSKFPSISNFPRKASQAYGSSKSWEVLRSIVLRSFPELPSLKLC